MTETTDDVFLMTLDDLFAEKMFLLEQIQELWLEKDKSPFWAFKKKKMIAEEIDDLESDYRYADNRYKRILRFYDDYHSLAKEIADA